MKQRSYSWMMVLALGASPAWAQFDSGSDGTDGDFNATANIEIDLSLAPTAVWTTPGTGVGVYDPNQWAVVFKYGTINVDPGVTVTFKNHPKGAPVVWLASGDVTLSGIVNLDGKNGNGAGASPSFAEPGPGGFPGGKRFILPNIPPTGSFGPGGAIAGTITEGVGGGYGSEGQNNVGSSYGDVTIMPLIGGSGGSGRNAQNFGGGGAGGGAILIASTGQIVLESSGRITAAGGVGHGFNGGGSGSGGGIRLVADTVSGGGQLRAIGPTSSTIDGGVGRIRVDSNTINLPDGGIPSLTWGMNMIVFPPANIPTLRATMIDGVGVPIDPGATIATPDMAIHNAQSVTINIEATNIPVGTTVDVIFMPGEFSDRFVVTSNPLVDAGGGLLTATAFATIPPGRTDIQLKANFTP